MITQCLPVTNIDNGSGRRRTLRRAVGTPLTASAVALAVVVALAGPAAAAPLDGLLSGSGSRQALGTGTLWGDRDLDQISLDPTSREYDPRRDPSSLYSITTAIGARRVWEQRDARGAAITGKGVTVAVLDSGVAPVAGLSGRLVQGPDLSLESQSPQRLSPDTFGHGTHMASIIGAADAVPTSASGAPRSTDGRAQLGVAPGAQLLALKLANTDGSTDVSQVIAGIDWVVEHRNDNGMNVRVINLSYGTDAQQSYRSDPLAAAVERAWQRGIVVVASAGNDGPGSGGLNDPAYDPYVVAVGSTSPDRSVLGQVLGATPLASQSWRTPSASEYTSRGTSSRTPDLAAPGRSVVGLLAEGSTIDRDHPEGRVAGDSSGRLLRGSGTSQAAAVVSGAAALLLQADPGLTPDAVKAALTSTTQAVRGGDRRDVGSGQVDVSRALGVVQRAAAGYAPAKAQISKRQSFATSTGLGSLEASRGSSHLVDPETGQELRGEVDVQGRAWDGRAWNRAASQDATWSEGSYLGAAWSGDSWASSTSWKGVRWSGVRWSGVRWSSTDWDGVRWSGVRWSSSRYDGVRWS